MTGIKKQRFTVKAESNVNSKEKKLKYKSSQIKLETSKELNHVNLIDISFSIRSYIRYTKTLQSRESLANQKTTYA